MTAIEVNSFVRMLSTVYVYFWIPIRLNYLRLKFKLRPVLKVFGEVFAISALLITGIPLSVVYMLAKGLAYIIELWTKWLCNIIEETTGIDRESLYTSVLSDDCPEIPEENDREQPINEAVSELVESEDKNEQDNTE